MSTLTQTVPKPRQRSAVSQPAAGSLPASGTQRFRSHQKNLEKVSQEILLVNSQSSCERYIKTLNRNESDNLDMDSLFAVRAPDSKIAYSLLKMRAKAKSEYQATDPRSGEKIKHAEIRYDRMQFMRDLQSEDMTTREAAIKILDNMTKEPGASKERCVNAVKDYNRLAGSLREYHAELKLQIENGAEYRPEQKEKLKFVIKRLNDWKVENNKAKKKFFSPAARDFSKVSSEPTRGIQGGVQKQLDPGTDPKAFVKAIVDGDPQAEIVWKEYYNSGQAALQEAREDFNATAASETFKKSSDQTLFSEDIIDLVGSDPNTFVKALIEGHPDAVSEWRTCKESWKLDNTGTMSSVPYEASDVKRLEKAIEDLSSDTDLGSEKLRENERFAQIKSEINELSSLLSPPAEPTSIKPFEDLRREIGSNRLSEMSQQERGISKLVGIGKKAVSKVASWRPWKL